MSVCWGEKGCLGVFCLDRHSEITGSSKTIWLIVNYLLSKYLNQSKYFMLHHCPLYFQSGPSSVWPDQDVHEGTDGCKYINTRCGRDNDNWVRQNSWSDAHAALLSSKHNAQAPASLHRSPAWGRAREAGFAVVLFKGNQAKFTWIFTPSFILTCSGHEKSEKSRRVILKQFDFALSQQ